MIYLLSLFFCLICLFLCFLLRVPNATSTTTTTICETLKESKWLPGANRKMITRNEFPGNSEIEKLRNVAPLALSRHIDKNQHLFMSRPAKNISFSSQNISPRKIFYVVLPCRDKILEILQILQESSLRLYHGNHENARRGTVQSESFFNS